MFDLNKVSPSTTRFISKSESTSTASMIVWEIWNGIWDPGGATYCADGMASAQQSQAIQSNPISMWLVVMTGVLWAPHGCIMKHAININRLFLNPCHPSAILVTVQLYVSSYSISMSSMWPCLIVILYVPCSSCCLVMGALHLYHHWSILTIHSQLKREEEGDVMNLEFIDKCYCMGVWFSFSIYFVNCETFIHISHIHS
jgi:hypothetical protein